LHLKVFQRLYFCTFVTNITSIIVNINIFTPFNLVLSFNSSLREGFLPASQKHAIISPLLKKSSLDGGEMKNYRPVSNVTFISKDVVRVVVDQVVRYLQTHDLLPRLQSA